MGAKLVTAQLPEDLRGGQRATLFTRKRQSGSYRKAEDSNRNAYRRAYLRQNEGAYTGKWQRRRHLGEERGSGTFSQGETIGGPPPPLATARLLPSEPRTRTVLTPPPTLDKPPRGRRCFKGIRRHLRSHVSHQLRRRREPCRPQVGLRRICRLPHCRAPQRRLRRTISRLWKKRNRRSHHRRQHCRCSHRHHGSSRFWRGCHTLILIEGHHCYL